MSYGFMPYAVEFDALRDLFGCRDEELLAEFLREMADMLEEADSEESAWGDEELPLPAATALRQLVMGEPLDRDRGHVYAYVVRDLCWAYDEFLGNGWWSPIRMEWISDRFDPELRAAGVPPDLFGVGSHLMNRGSPFPIPEPSDFPGMGYLLPEEVPAVADVLAGIDPERFRRIDGHEQLAALRGWLERCRETGWALITFYH